MLLRTTLVALLCTAMLVLGLPLAGADSALPPAIPETVAERVSGLSEAPGSIRALTAAAGTARESLPTRAPIPFSMVGFELPAGTEGLDFRTSADGATWQPWTEAEIETADEGPEGAELDGAAVERFTEPVWVDEATHLQVRVSGASPRDLGVHVIDSSGLGRSLASRFRDRVATAWAGTPDPLAAQVDSPAVVSRASWGADESWRRYAPSYAKAARAIVVHHTAGSNDYSRDDAAAVVRGIYRYHTQSLGWADIGYNVLVDRYGTVYEGRFGGLERPVVGAHARGYNTGTVGVALMGQHDTGSNPPGAAPTTAALGALADVVAWKADLHHIDPEATVTIGGTGNYAAKTVPTILGHRDVTATACPGNTVYRELPALRDTVARRIGDMIVQPDVSPASIRFTDRTAKLDEVVFTAGLKPSGAWSLQVLDDRGFPVHLDSGTGTTVRSTWRPPLRAGVYTWELSGGTSRRLARGEVSVLRDVVERIGVASGAAAASVEISKATFSSSGSAKHAVLARADVFADAMSGGPLAGRDGPLLLTSSSGLDEEVRTELERVLPAGETVYVLGGDAAISDDVVDDVEEDWEVQRVSGLERTETAAKVAERVRARSGVTTAMIARAGPDDAAPWADALAGGAYGAREGIPVLLTPTDSLSSATRAALRGIDRTIVLGGDAAISEAVVRQLPGPTRISGNDRTETSVAIARQLWGRTSGRADDVVFIGDAYADGAWVRSLAASPMAARRGAPLLLTSSATLSPPTASYLEGLGYSEDDIASGVVLGGTSSISDRVVADVSKLLQ